MMTLSKISVSTLAALALIAGSSAPAFASPGMKAAVACQGGLQGCVLPVGNAAPAPAPAAAPVVPPAAAPAAAATSQNWLLPALLGLAAIVGGFLLLDGNGDDEPVSL